MRYLVICEDSRQQDGASFATREEAQKHLDTTSYPVARWIEEEFFDSVDTCGWCNMPNLIGGKSIRESDGCCGNCGAI